MRSKKAIYNIFSNLLLQIIMVVYGFIVPKIIINNFGSNVNGLISSITQFLAYVALLESGFGPVVKVALYKPIANKDKNTIANILKTTEKFFRTIAFIFLIYIVVLCFVYPLLVSKDFDSLFTVSLVIIIAISTFAEYFFGMTYRLYLQAEQKSYVISVIQIYTYILSVISIVVLVKLGCNIQIIKLVSGVIFVLRPIIQNLYVKKKYKISFKNTNEKYELKQKWDGLAQHIAAVIHGNTDITVLTIFVSLAEVSVYSVYYLVVKGLKSIIQAFSNGIDASFGDMIAKGEIDNLNRKFGIYEVIYFLITTLCFSCAMVFIVPFISLFTKGITDANYVRYLFGYLIVISEYIWAIRLPYSSITLAAGHFKETRIGAWVEAISNIVISVILVMKYGIIGVTIGTIVSMTIRTIEFVYHTNKYILHRSIWHSIKKIIIVIIETVAIVLIFNNIKLFANISYKYLIINGIIMFSISTIIVALFTLIFYRKETKEILKIFKRLFKKNNGKKEISNAVTSMLAPEDYAFAFDSFDSDNINNYLDDLDRVKMKIRFNNSVIGLIDFNKCSDEISDVILSETKVYNFEFNNKLFLRKGKYPKQIANNYELMKYIIDQDYNNLAYVDVNNIGNDNLIDIINYAFTKVYYMKIKNSEIDFDIDNIFKNSSIIKHDYFKECYSYIKKMKGRKKK